MPDARDQMLRVRVSRVTKLEVREIADAEGRTESDVVRRLLNEALLERARRRR
jgi:antitoxin component of RelBE/YafQ-DinJ toxin-antitoxin module